MAFVRQIQMGAGATKFKLIVNLKTAKAFGLAVPPHCLDAPTSCRIEMPFAAAHESVHGTFRTCGLRCLMSVIGGKADVALRPGDVAV